MTTKPSCSTFWLIRLHVWPHQMWPLWPRCCQQPHYQSGWGGTMQSARSWHADLCACHACSRSRQQSHHGQSQRHRYCRHRSQCSAGTSWARSSAVVGCLWPRTVPEVGSCSWLVVHSCRKEQRDALLPCLHWLRFRFSIPWQREEVCLANLRCLWWDFRCLQQTHPTPTGSGRWRPEDLGEVRGHDVRQIQHSSTKPFVQLDLRWSSTSVTSTSTRNADSCQLGLHQERRSVADRLDRAPTHCRELPAADQVWMQVGMLQSMQMLPLWSDLHCAAADARFRSVVVYSSRQQDNKWQTSIGLLLTCTSNNISDRWCLWYGHFLP